MASSFVDNHERELSDWTGVRDTYFYLLQRFYVDVRDQTADVLTKEKRNICALWRSFQAKAATHRYELKDDLNEYFNKLCGTARYTAPRSASAGAGGASDASAEAGGAPEPGRHRQIHENFAPYDKDLAKRLNSTEKFFKWLGTRMGPTGKGILMILQKQTGHGLAFYYQSKNAFVNLINMTFGLFEGLGFAREAVTNNWDNIRLFTRWGACVMVAIDTISLGRYTFGPEETARVQENVSSLDEFSPSDLTHIINYIYGRLKDDPTRNELVGLQATLGSLIVQQRVGVTGEVGLFPRDERKLFINKILLLARRLSPISVESLEGMFSQPNALQGTSFSLPRPDIPRLTARMNSVIANSTFFSRWVDSARGSVGSFTATNRGDYTLRAFCSIIIIVWFVIYAIDVSYATPTDDPLEDAEEVDDDDDAKNKSEFGRWLRAMFGGTSVRSKKRASTKKKQASIVLKCKGKRTSTRRKKRVSSSGKRTKNKKVSSFKRKHRSAKKKVERRKK